MNLGREINDATYRQAEQMCADGQTNEQLLEFLQQSGANAISSIQALRRLRGISTAEAQQILHDSETWRGMR